MNVTNNGNKTLINDLKSVTDENQSINSYYEKPNILNDSDGKVFEQIDQIENAEDKNENEKLNEDTEKINSIEDKKEEINDQNNIEDNLEDKNKTDKEIE